MPHIFHPSKYYLQHILPPPSIFLIALLCKCSLLDTPAIRLRHPISNTSSLCQCPLFSISLDVYLYNYIFMKWTFRLLDLLSITLMVTCTNGAIPIPIRKTVQDILINILQCTKHRSLRNTRHRWLRSRCGKLNALLAMCRSTRKRRFNFFLFKHILGSHTERTVPHGALHNFVRQPMPERFLCDATFCIYKYAFVANERMAQLFTLNYSHIRINLIKANLVKPWKTSE